MFKRTLTAAVGCLLLFVSAASAQVTSSDPNVTVTLLKSGLSGPAGLAFRPLSLPQPTHDLVVSKFGTGTVSLVDAITGNTTSYVSQSQPTFVAVRASDDLVAVSTQLGTVVNFYDTTGALKGTISAGFAGAPTTCLVGVAFDSAGNFYVATGTSTSLGNGCPSQVSAAASSIYEFPAATPSSGGSSIASGLDALQGLAFSTRPGPSGSLFAVSNFNGNIYQTILGPNTTSTIATDPRGGADDPTGIIVDPVKENIYITEFTGGYVLKLHLPTLGFSQVATGFTNPFGIGFDNGGNGYVADFGTGDIWKFSLSGPFPGDVIVAVGNAQYNVYHNIGSASLPNYVLADTINDGTGGVTTTGCAFDSASNLFTTNFFPGKVVEFDASAHIPVFTIDTSSEGAEDNESLVKDSSNNLYVGIPDPTVESAQALLLKYGATNTFLTSFTPDKEIRGTDWIDLAADQKTIFYTSEGKHVKRFNVSTSTQLTDFNSTALTGTAAYALKLLPPFDGTGGLLVADTDAIRRLDGSGNILAQTYTAACTEADPCPFGRLWFALALDPNATSFWAGDINTGDLFRFNIATAAIEVGPIATGAVAGSGGICVKGEPAAVNSAVLTFPANTTSTQVALFNAGTPDANSWKATINTNTAFSITLTEHEVVCDTGVACNGDDFDGLNNYRCRWEEYFRSDPQLPLGIPYSHNMCVFYRVENPPPDGEIQSNLTFTVGYNDPSGSPYGTCAPEGAVPRLFRDPSENDPNYPLITDAADNHSFAIDATSAFNPSGKPGDPTISGDNTKILNDYAVACRFVSGLGTDTAAWIKPKSGAMYNSGQSVPFEVQVTSLGGGFITNAATAPNSMPLNIYFNGLLVPTVGNPGGSPGFWTYDPINNFYTANWKIPKGSPVGPYTACVSSNVSLSPPPLFQTSCVTFALVK